MAERPSSDLNRSFRISFSNSICCKVVKPHLISVVGAALIIRGYDISLASPGDIPGILALQEPNLPDNGGSLSVRQSADWFSKAIAEKSVVAGRRNGEVVGYVLGTSLAAKAHVTIVQTMLRTFPPPANCYLYGPVCVAETERGKGLAGALFEVLQAHMTGRPAMTFIRADNEPSLRAHRKMGMRELGPFSNGAEQYIALSYSPE